MAKRRKLTEEHKRKISEGEKKHLPKTHFKKGHIAWNKGTKGITKSWNKGKPNLNWIGDKNPRWSGGRPNCLDCGGWVSSYKTKRCEPCNKKYMIGELHPQWKGGITPEIVKIRNSSIATDWAKAIKKRDDYKCQICGVVGGKKLRSNHIKKFADYPELRFELTNGITICTGCDLKWVMYHEPEWESYFNFNLMTRNYLTVSDNN